MKPAPFNYERPTSLDAVLGLLAGGNGETKIIAGGQSLVPMMNFRVVRPDRLVDINRLRELDYHRVDGSELVIGALCRHATLKDSEIVKNACPLMHAAYRWVAHGPVRNRGTLCGNLCHADPASEMPAVAQAVNAVMVLRSRAGERRMPAEEFNIGIYETAARPDEMLVEIRIPVALKQQGWGFHEVSVRRGDFAIVAVCATMQISQRKVTDIAIVLAGVGGHAVRLRSIGQTLLGKQPTDATLRQIGADCAVAVSPTSDIHGDAEYRRDLVRALVPRALGEARDHCS
jgi:aerobic carbon-monoxide dehydrogenase medium subunit